MCETILYLERGEVMNHSQVVLAMVVRVYLSQDLLRTHLKIIKDV